MSPLRRFWIAWGGGWVWLVVAGWTLIIAGMTVAALRTGSGDFPPISERPFAFLLIMPLFLSLRLRQLLGADSLGLAPSHASWVLRWFCLVILPLATFSIAIPLALTGITPLWALAVAACLVAVGAWLGFACFVSIPAFIAAFALISVLHLITARSGWVGDVVAIATLILVAISVRTAWRRLEARAVPAWVGWSRSPRLDRISAWFDDRLMSPPTPVAANRRLPTLATAAHLGLSGLGGSWLLRLIGMLGTAIGAFVLSSQAPDVADRLPILLCGATLMACALAPGWLWSGKGDSPLSSGQARQRVRGLLAGERLRPLSRRRAAAATLLAITGNCLSSVLPLTGGMMLGLVLADIWVGRDSTGLWLLFPHTLAVTACSAAGMILFEVVPFTVTIICAFILSNLLIGAPMVAMSTGMADMYPSAPTIAILLALILVPLAWHRLAEAELP